jgi:serine protease Do
VKVDQIYRDPLNDLAILKVTPTTKLKALTMGDSDGLRLGQTTIAIGTPLGEFTNSVTKGIISGLGRGITAGSPFEGFVEKLDNVIQTDTPISPGNSGGPLLNSSGEVIGINTAVSSEGENIGFAIPVNIIKTLLQEFEKRGGNFERPFMGIEPRMIDRKTAIMNDLVEGAYVVRVVEGSPAEKAGIQEEDVITKIDGVKVVTSDDQSITRMLLDKKIGQTIQVTLWRNGEEKTVSVTLSKFTN